jgi:hypothetical protein
MVISLVNTLVIATGERRREFTLHRLIELTGRQIMRKRWEAVSDSSSEQLSSHSSAPPRMPSTLPPRCPPTSIRRPLPGSRRRRR